MVPHVRTTALSIHVMVLLSAAMACTPTPANPPNFVVIDDVRTLPQKLPQLYRRLTT